MKRGLHLFLGATLVSLAPACEDTLPPRGQVVVHLDTDAPVAVAPLDDTLAALRVPLFDRVLVELFPPAPATSPCDECVRELPIDAGKLREGSFSFGFVPPPRVVGYRMRARMFRSAGRGAPRAASTIELVGYLPAVGEDGITHVTATFLTADVGKPRGTLDAPIVFDKGEPAASREGTWPEGAIVDCAGPAPKSAVCVPGGAFFAGDPRVTLTDERTAGARERLVTLAPFYIDDREITVGAMRASRLAEVNSRGLAVDPVDDQRDTFAGKCDYTSAPGPYEDRPVSCVSWQLASRYCRERGGSLPSADQLEIVASRRGASLYPWGNHDPSCEDAVVGRQRARASGGCGRAADLEIGGRVIPEIAGSGANDRVVLPGGEIKDLGANLAEWTVDRFQGDDGRDVPDAHATKGGDFERLPVDYAQVRRARTTSDTSFQYATVGFRCAYPAERASP